MSTTSERFEVDTEAGESHLGCCPSCAVKIESPLPPISNSSSSDSPSLATNTSPNAANLSTPDIWWDLDAKEERAYVETSQFNDYLREERSKNVFSKGVTGIATKSERRLPQYSLESVLRFTAATNYWATVRHQNLSLPYGSKYSNLETQGTHPGIHAFYKVIKFVQEGRMNRTRNDKYILSACHFFVHGNHRGDLLYLEADCTTMIRDFDHNCLHQLYIVDVVMVSAISLGEGIKSNAFPQTIPEKCVWKVARMTILTRDINMDVPYYYLESIDRAAVAGSSKPHSVVMEKKTEKSG